MVLILPFWRPYGELVVLGRKTLETRGRAWARPPSWLGVYLVDHVDLSGLELGSSSVRPVTSAGSST